MSVFVVFVDDQRNGPELISVRSDIYMARLDRDAALHACGKPGADAWLEEWEVDGGKAASHDEARVVVSLPYPPLKKELVTL